MLLLRNHPGALAALVVATLAASALLPSAAARPTADPPWLVEINAYRTASGLAPVANEPSWSAGIQAHNRYLAQTDPKYYTGDYASAHTENPASPYYTPEGALEASRSDIGGADSDTGAIAQWLEAPFHAIGMLRPQLTRVAYARDPASGYTGLDVIGGLDYSRAGVTTPIVFPGNGMTTDLHETNGESPSPIETCGWDFPAGLPIIVLLPKDPDRSVAASLTRPDGSTITTGGPDLCLVDRYTFKTSDPVYGPTGRSILQGDHAVFVIPRERLHGGRYEVHVTQSGTTPLDLRWSFTETPLRYTVGLDKDGDGNGTVTSDPALVTCDEKCSTVEQAAEEGTTVTLHATAARGSLFAGWSGACTGSADCKLTISDDVHVSATFERGCVVPNVVGKPFAAAERAILAANCALGRLTFTRSKKRRNTVVAQQPGPGATLPAERPVAISVSRGPR